MIALPYRWIAAALALVAMLAATWWHGHGAGVRSVQTKWDAEKLAISMQRDADAVIAQQASATYQQQLAKIQGRTVALQGKLRDALNKPIPTCPATLGAVVVDRDTIGLLRSAGADPSP